MSKIILFGANGMLGRYLHVYLQTKYEVIPVNRDQFDVLKSNVLDLDNLMIKIECDSNTVIVNCIGLIPQRCSINESSDNLYIRVNSEFPHLLNAMAQKYKCHYIHITTDCVYDGNKGQYTEQDLATEKNMYGKSKSLGEPNTATVIRTSIIGEEIKNKKSLIEWVKSQNGNTINGYDNHYWNGVTCLQLAKIIDQIIKNNNFWIGVRHIFSPDSVSKYELVSMIVEVYKLNINVNKHTTDKLCNKTLSTIYSTNNEFNISALSDQINELVHFKLT